MSTNLAPELKIANTDLWPEQSVISKLPGSPAAKRLRHRGWFVWGLIVAAGLLALGIDVALSRVMVHGHPSLWQGKGRELVHELLGSFEPFGQPAAIITVTLAVYLCGGNRRQFAFRILTSFGLASLAPNAIKMCIARVRPVHFNFQGTVFDTFPGIFWGTTGGTANQSFPSGHTTAAVAFGLALAAIFPRGRWLFITLAALVAVQRIECGAHYLSDTLFATSLAWVIHVAVFETGPLCRWLDQFESKRSGD